MSVRRAAILFAIVSTVYWQGAAWFLSQINPLAGIDILPLLLVAAINVGTATLYAVVTLLFCHWLARRVLRQAQQKLEP